MRARSEICSIGPSNTVYEAIAMMADKGVGALLVLEGPVLVGIVSERDYTRRVVLADKASRTTAVAEIMTSKVVYVEPQETVAECLAVMTDKRIRHLPIMEGGELVGMVSIGDLVRATIAEQKFVIDELQHYIGG